MTMQEINEREQLIKDIREYFNAKPVSYNYQKTLVLCSEIHTQQWILVDLETTDGKNISDDEATRLCMMWMKQAINVVSEPTNPLTYIQNYDI